MKRYLFDINGMKVEILEFTLRAALASAKRYGHAILVEVQREVKSV